jgi:hypothetical protein
VGEALADGEALAARPGTLRGLMPQRAIPTRRDSPHHSLRVTAAELIYEKDRLSPMRLDRSPSQG